MRVDDADRLCVASILNPVTRLGHFNGALMGQLCKAPKPFGGEDPLRLSSCADAARCDPAQRTAQISAT